MATPSRRYSETELDSALTTSLAREVAELSPERGQVRLDIPVTRMVEALEWRIKTVTTHKRTLFGGTRVVTAEVPYEAPVTRAEVTSEPVGAWALAGQHSGGITRRGSTTDNWDIHVDLYLLEDGSFASITRRNSLLTYQNGKYDFHEENPEVKAPVSAVEAAQLADKNADFSLCPGVVVAGDGLRESLIRHAPENERARLRRDYPSLARDAAPKLHRGTLVRFLPAKGFGFIQHPELGEVFLHMSQIPVSERPLLAPGASISFTVRKGPKGLAVASGRVVG